jgi:hypothetical protein
MTVSIRPPLAQAALRPNWPKPLDHSFIGRPFRRIKEKMVAMQSL